MSGEPLCFFASCLTEEQKVRAANKDITAFEKEIKTLQTSISGTQQEVVILTDVQNKTINMADSIDTAIGALQHITNQWYTIQAKYETLVGDVQNMSLEELSLIQSDLNIAKKDWQDLRSYAEQVQMFYSSTQNQ